MKIAVCVMAIMVMCLCPGRISEEKNLVSVERMRHKAKPSSKKQVEKLETNLEQKIKTVSAKIENEAETSGKKREEIYKSVKGVETKIINIEDKVNDLKNTSNWQSEKVNHQIEDLAIHIENATQHSVEIYSSIETLENDVKSLAQTIQDNINDQSKMSLQIMRMFDNLTVFMAKLSEEMTPCATTTTPAAPTTSTSMMKGVLIAGGHGTDHSADLFLPHTGKTCLLKGPGRASSSLSTIGNQTILCGGGYYATPVSCLQFLQTSSTGSWVHYATLAIGRWRSTTHVFKGEEEDALMLVGGHRSPETTEILGRGRQYDLEQDTYDACSIPDHSSFILTGGKNSQSGYLKSVARYNSQEFVENLPDLAKARGLHGCGFYIDTTNKKVMVVAGGAGDAGYLSSTEMLIYGAKSWIGGESLPRPISSMASVTMDNYILLIGGGSSDGTRREILKFNGNWTEVGKMKIARATQAATTIQVGGELDISACI